MLNRPIRIWQAIVIAAAVAMLAGAATTFSSFSSSRVLIRAEQFTIPPDSVRGQRVKCERGTLALGGGVDVENPLLQDLRETSQWDSADEDVIPDDGWQARVFNHSTDQTLGATVIVTCG